MKRYKIGVIGGGINSAVGYAHFVSSKIDGLFEYKAACFSRNKGVNIESANVFGIEKEFIFDSIENLIELAHNHIDIWLVLLPTNLHYEVLLKLKVTNKPVICEKALCCSVNEINHLLKFYNETNLFVIYNYTAYPMVREIKQLIKNNEIGEIITVNLKMPQSGFIKRNNNNEFFIPQEWRQRDSDISMLSLDLGVHLHSLLKFITNLEVENVYAFNNSKGFSNQIIDNIQSVIYLNNGAIGNFWYSKTALGNSNGLAVEIYGTKGSISWIQLNPDEFKLSNQFNETKIIDRTNNNLKEAGKIKYNRFKAGHPTGFIEALGNYYHSIYNKLIGQNEEFIFPLEESKKGLDLMEKLEWNFKN